jgi:tRNA(fMet)-specific endonuclease VapC
VLSEPIKSIPNARVMKSIASKEGTMATCAVVWHELRFGCERLPSSRRKNAIAAYLEEAVRRALPILPYDEEAAAWHARERARLARRGRHPSAADAQIAAISVVNELILVTANARDFRRFEGVRIEDWSR